ncbi:MAG TPA: hypothetical protein VKB93_10620 [Thermoanaerobaculia bacterium]|nr:hypothetical protein [Thermoanaerobaculia bacterium]
MHNRRRELGEGKVGCLFGLVILLLAGMVAYKMIPVKVKAAEMRDETADLARSAGQHNDAWIAKALLEKGQKLELPVTEQGIQINRANGEIRVDVDYTVPVQFPGYTYQWHFHHRAENPIF